MTATFPAIERNEPYARLLGHLLFGQVDRETAKPLLSAGLLAQLEGEERAYLGKNYRGLDLLQSFRRDVMPGFEWSVPVWVAGGTGTCRLAQRVPVPRGLAEAAELERRRPAISGSSPVNFTSGRPFGARDRRRLNDADRGAASAVAAEAECEATRRICVYLNGLPSNSFTRLLKDVPRAYSAALAIERPERREYALRVLRRVEEQPQPFYGPSEAGNTVRVCARGTTLLALPREVRSALTCGWTWLDFKACQLAVAATDWGVRELDELLRSGKYVWDEFVSALGPVGVQVVREGRGALRYGVAKQLAKSMTYAVVFGMSRRHLRRLGHDDEEGRANRALAAALGIEPEAAGDAFVRHPVCRALLEARDRQLRAVREGGGGVDIFGRFIPCAGWEEAPSVLAQRCQAAELRLLLSAVILAEGEAERAAEAGRSPEWRLTLALHDGFAVAVTNASKRERTVAAIQRAVTEEALALGYPTALEVA